MAVDESGATMKSISIYSEYYTESWLESTSWAIRDDHPKLEPELARRIVDYLDASSIVLVTTGKVVDKVKPSNGAVVSVFIFTDGYYYWNDSLRYYIDKYHLSPGEEFIEHCRQQNFEVGAVEADRIRQVMRELQG